MAASSEKPFEIFDHGQCITLGCTYLFSTNEENNSCGAKNGATVFLLREMKATTGGTLEGGSVSNDGNQEGGAEPKVSIYTMPRGIELRNVPWGEYALSVARELLQQYSSYMEIYAFMITPPGKISVRLHKLSETNEATRWETIQEYANEYWKRLKEVGPAGAGVALEVMHVLDAEKHNAAGRLIMINIKNGRMHIVK